MWLTVWHTLQCVSMLRWVHPSVCPYVCMVISSYDTCRKYCSCLSEFNVCGLCVSMHSVLSHIYCRFLFHKFSNDLVWSNFCVYTVCTYFCLCILCMLPLGSVVYMFLCICLCLTRTLSYISQSKQTACLYVDGALLVVHNGVHTAANSPAPATPSREWWFLACATVFTHHASIQDNMVDWMLVPI